MKTKINVTINMFQDGEFCVSATREDGSMVFGFRGVYSPDAVIVKMSRYMPQNCIPYEDWVRCYPCKVLFKDRG